MLGPPADVAARFGRDLARLIDPAVDRVLVAVSGGPDSVALLLLAHAVLGARCLAATVDHGLRRESAEEARFVAALCAERGIAHATLTGELPPRVRGSANVSQRARSLRYALLDAHAAAAGAWLATAHHADDQLETLVMRLNRGAGVAGLGGIRVAAGRRIRPLLGWRRATLAQLVRDCGIVPVDDPTNRDDRYDRARLRKALVEADWIDPERAVASARALAEAEDALAWTTRRLVAERVSGGGTVLAPRDLPPELLRRLVTHCVAAVDPAADPSGPALTRLIARLDAGGPATIREVIVRVQGAGTAAESWQFLLAPPRRSL